MEIIHVDDDPLSLAYIKGILSKLEGISYAGSFANAKDALAHIQRSTVSTIVILDIEMPQYDGLWLAKRVEDLDVSIIFMTAHTGYAVQAFEACALQYLIKPVSYSKLEEAIRYVIRIQNKGTINSGQINEVMDNYPPGESYPKKVFINNTNLVHILDLTKVMYINASGHYCHFITADGKKFLSSKNLKVYEDTICRNPKFIRIHRSSIINVDFVQSISRNGHITLVQMKDDQTLEISPAKKDTVLQRISAK